MTKSSKHDQRGILPPRCTHNGCRQPGIIICEYGAYCREHYEQLIKWIYEEGHDDA